MFFRTFPLPIFFTQFFGRAIKHFLVRENMGVFLAATSDPIKVLAANKRAANRTFIQMILSGNFGLLQM
jgi:hypothetical protein